MAGRLLRNPINHCCLSNFWLSAPGCYRGPSFPPPHPVLLYLVLSLHCYFSQSGRHRLNCKASAKLLGRSRPAGSLAHRSGIKKTAPLGSWALGVWLGTWGRAGFPGMGTALPELGLLVPGSGLRSLAALIAACLGREARVGAGGGRRPARHPGPGELRRAQPRARGTQSARAGSQGSPRLTWKGAGAGHQQAAVSFTLEDMR